LYHLVSGGFTVRRPQVTDNLRKAITRGLLLVRLLAFGATFEEEGSLGLKVRHSSPGFSTWDEELVCRRRN
jgi:hypothetical protein